MAVGLCKVTFSRVVVTVFVLFLAYYCYIIYHVFNPPQCNKNQRQTCLVPVYGAVEHLELWVYTSPRVSFTGTKDCNVILHKTDFLRTNNFEEEVNITLPHSTLKNGSLYVHVFLGPKGKSPQLHSNIGRIAATTALLTRYAVPQATKFNLIMGESENSTVDETPVTHWIPWLEIHTLSDDFKFDRYNLPPEMFRMLHFLPGTRQYLPILYIDRLKVMNKHLQPLSHENSTVSLKVSYGPVGIGQLRLWLLFAGALHNMKALGFSEKEFDDVKGIFLDTSLWLLGLTILVSFFHLLFDFLAFKNDVSFWRRRKTMVGLSSRAIVWRCFSQVVVFFYLLDEKTSLLILVPAGIASIIEFWKVAKAFKFRVKWSGPLPWIERGARLDVEKRTESYDSEAMQYLSYLLYPLVIAGAVYQLAYSSYKSWYSWVIHSLVNGVYAFGFLFMLPQLFVNYKLKSVAHLPWRAFMYKAFNTFIDDVFAFIITMPTSHRLAVFRDDLVFIVYLYQRWLYPVDKSRVNEFGESFEGAKEHKD